MTSADPRNPESSLPSTRGTIVWNELFRIILDLREARASGILTITVREFAERVRFQGGRVVSIEPAPGAGDLESVARRLRALMGLRQGEFHFETGPLSPGVPGFDPAGPLFSWFDSKKAESEQAAHLSSLWNEPLRQGPRLAALRSRYQEVFGPAVVEATLQGATIAELIAQSQDALVLLQQVFAAVTTEMVAIGSQQQWAQAGGSEEGTEDADPWIGLTTYRNRVEALKSRPAATESVPLLLEPELAAEALAEQEYVLTDRPETPLIAGLELPAEVVRRGELDLKETRREPPRRPLELSRSEVSQQQVRAATPGFPASPVRVNTDRSSTNQRVASVLPPPAASPLPPPISAPANPRPAAAPALSPPSNSPFSSLFRPSSLTDSGPAESGELRLPKTSPSSPPSTATARRSTTSGPSSTPRSVTTGRTATTENSSAEKKIRSLDELREWLAHVESSAQEGSHYALLMLPENATDKAIQEQRTAWIRLYHPDLFRRVSIGDLHTRLDSAWKIINNAVSILLDKTKRKEHDILLERKRKGLPTDVNVILEAERIFKDGDRLLKGHRYDEALDRFKKAIQLNRAEPEFRVCKAWCEYVIAKTQGPLQPALREKTKELILAAIAAQENLDRGHYYLGMIFKDEGRDRDASHHFAQAVKINPYHIDAKREIRMLSQKGIKEESRGGGGSSGGLFGRRR